MQWHRSFCVMGAIVLAVTASTTRAGLVDMVTVGNPGNAPDSTGYGAVNYVYQIGKYEVTNAQYTAFLNAVAATDNYGLYNTEMSGTYGAGIQRSGSSGSYTYSVADGWANRPVNWVSWGDAARFANWLHNGQGSGSTETGAYTLNGATDQTGLMAVTRNADAKYWIPTENEWYKAAYHKNDGVTGNYYPYPTSSDTIDTSMANYGNPVGNTTDVGTYSSNASPYGTFDQGGNVYEWNETTVFDSLRGLRGGYWEGNSSSLQSSFRYFGNPAHESTPTEGSAWQVAQRFLSPAASH